MLSAENHQEKMFRAVTDNIAELVKMPPDLSFMCSGGKMVHSHKSFVLVFSPVLRSALSPLLSSMSSVVSLPDISSSALEQALDLLRSRWDDVTISDDLKDVFNALGIDIKQCLVDSGTAPARGRRKKRASKEASIDQIVSKSTTSEILQSDIIDSEAKSSKIERRGRKRNMKVGHKFPRDDDVEEDREDDDLKAVCDDKLNGRRNNRRSLNSSIDQIVSNSKNANENKNIIDSTKSERRVRKRSLKAELEFSKDDLDEEAVASTESETRGRKKTIKSGLKFPPQAKKAQCTMCEKNWKKDTGTNIYQLRSLIKNHICKKHFEADMTVLLDNNFNGDCCKLCESSIKTDIEQKKHLQNQHGIFDDVIKPMLDDILGPSKSELKRKRTGSTKFTAKKLRTRSKSGLNMNTDISDLLTNSPQTTGSDSENLEETSDFKRLQSCIEYSDSEEDDDDNAEAMLSVIQSNIDYSDSDDED